MKRLLVLFIYFVACLQQAQAQSTEWQEWEKRGQKQINLLPMYGNKPKPKDLVALDKKFLKRVEKEGGTRAENSKYFSDRGWQFLQNQDLETAMFRFNQAWLLDSTNAHAYWGFGVITGILQNHGGALVYLNKAYSKDSSDIQLLCDLTLAHYSQYLKTNQLTELQKAEEVSQKALVRSTDNEFVLYARALVLYAKQDYPGAWEYLYKSKGKGGKAITPAFLKDLHAKLPDPRKELVKD